MAQLIPGRRANNFIDQYAKKIDDAVNAKLLDHDVYIRGINVPGIMETDIDPPDEFQKAPRMQIFHWHEKYGTNYRKGDIVTQGSGVWEIKEGYPVRGKGCWLKAHLKLKTGTQR